MRDAEVGYGFRMPFGGCPAVKRSFKPVTSLAEGMANSYLAG